MLKMPGTKVVSVINPKCEISEETEALKGALNEQ